MSYLTVGRSGSIPDMCRSAGIGGRWDTTRPRWMRCLKLRAVSVILGLTLAACSSAQPMEAEWVPCSGYGFSEGKNSYARCIKHIAMLTEPRHGGNP
jgi:hypothetical protein